MTGAEFLQRLADRDRPRIGGPVLAVVAHQDDETIGLGGQMNRFDDLLVVHVTDGAPADPAHAHRAGFPDRIAYAAARRREVAAAVALAGLGPDRLVALGHVDQTARDNLTTIAAEIGALIDRHRPAVVLTHAYEGGHPDHDAVAFAVDAAAQRSVAGPAVVAMPLYHQGGTGMVLQTFCDPRPDDVTVMLPEDAWNRKLRMLAAHTSQWSVLSAVTARHEAFRLTRDEDFNRLPNGGRLLYEGFGWGMTGAEWLERVAAARRRVSS